VTDHIIGRIRRALWSSAGDFVNLLYWFAAALMVYGAYRMVREPGWFILWPVALLVWTMAINGRATIVRLKGNLEKGFDTQPNILGIQRKKDQ
jgi:quinol-cytochrome oxidoreductase complex cytochrome b subunit